MEAIKLAELIRGVGVSRSPDAVITAVTTDSRMAGPGSLFVAIKGDRLDGHDYVAKAVAAGAEAVMVSERQSGDFDQIVVADTRDALIAAAGNYRSRFNPIAAAVTGSVGKTTTKEMTAAIFSQFGRTVKNEGNQNNEIGLPATLFSIDSTTELAVLEMGMNNFGDISKLTRAARPMAAIVTAIGVSHLENLKTQENILKAKLEIIEGLPEHGVLVLNGDDELLMGALPTIDCETATFAIDNTDCDVVARDIMTRENSSEFTIVDRINGSFKAMIPTIGEHNISDALAAYTAATRLGLDPARSAEALRLYQPTGMRQKMVDFGGITVVEDCYNANPDSMRASLTMLATLPVNGIRAAVVGDMLELGELSAEAHSAVGIQAARCGVDVLLCYGEEMRRCAESARAAGVPEVEHFEDKRAIADYLKKTLHSGDAVVFKGSRGMRLEEIIEMFYNS